MHIIISPSKAMDFKTPYKGNIETPRFLDQTQDLIKIMRKKSRGQLVQLMGISDSLAKLNHDRYKNFAREFTQENSHPAILAFKGNVYDGLKAEYFSKSQLQYAQKHLKILSGLYGLLRPMDWIQPYRLEMGTKLQTPAGENLYDFWENKLSDMLASDMNENSDSILINLASNEYNKAVKLKKFKYEVITPTFKEFKNGKYKMIMVYVKKARGMMARYIIENKIDDLKLLKKFNIDGYRYNEELSKGNDWVFTR
ncbi:peroxide stress protein YaaA [Rickettsiales bacterium]|nr:peroxide stress protein YaaA [Rickettsiales bacterium]